MTPQKILFIDRDGTLIVEPPTDKQVDSLEKLEFLPGVMHNLRTIASMQEYIFVMVTNQDGLGTDSFPEDTFWPAHNKMIQTLAGEGIIFDAVHIDDSFEHQNKPTRKPGTAMLKQYINNPKYDLANSIVLGDRNSDIQLAKNLGCAGILLSSEKNTSGDLHAKNWDEIVQILKNFHPRKATVERKTKETDIEVKLNLDEYAPSDISTGIGFFDHMLE